MPKSYWVAQSLKELEKTILILIVPLGLMGFFIEVLYPLMKIYTRRKINRWYRRMNTLDTYFENFTLNELKDDNFYGYLEPEIFLDTIELIAE